MLRDETWVVTGGAGRIATRLRGRLAASVRELRVVDAQSVHAEHANEIATVADVRDQAAMDAVVEGADGVLHLGGIPDEADFHDLVTVNVIGTHHVLEAARRNGTRRVVLASTNRVTGFYPSSVVVDPEMPPRPDGFYGVSKVAVEALGRLYADKFGLAVASVRIGSFEEAPHEERHLSTWLSPSDCLAALLAAMSTPDLTYTVFYAVSRNRRRWWDLAAGTAIGFEPHDDAEKYAAEIVSGCAPGSTPGGDEPQSGPYTSPEFTLERQR
jgi:uronate dehydrogenase